MRKTILFAMAVVFCACNVQVTHPDDKNNETHDWGEGNGVTRPVVLKLSSRQEQLLQQSNEFTLNLLQQVYANEKKYENVIISPLSASMALSMLMNGADGNTLKQVKDALGFGDWSEEDINEFNHLLLTALPRLDTCTQTELANSLWFQEGFPVKEGFTELNKQYFMAQVENVDFTNPATADLINAWAANHTHDLIKEVVDAETIYNCVALLANALYFKGVWNDKFEKDSTRNEDFTSSKNVKQVVDMMHKQGEMKYAFLKKQNAQLLELDYLGGAYCMDLLLPGKDDIPGLLKTIDAEEMTGWEETYWPEHKQVYNGDTSIWRSLNEVKLQMPKFTLRYKRELNEDLKMLGMTDMFDGNAANFSRMSDVPTYVSLVKQDTYMSVDEAGTEAAAVTVIAYEKAIAPENMPKMYLNRPFVLFIREKQYGTILFAAVIGNPNEKK